MNAQPNDPEWVRDAEWMLNEIQNSYYLRSPHAVFPNGAGWRAIPGSVEELMSLDKDAQTFYLYMLENWNGPGWWERDDANQHETA